jgi:hydroxyquinol 1,2-dioxygenase
MRDYGADNITQAVLERVAQAEDKRTREISAALVRHLHAFVREIEPSMEEWESAIDFLTRTGQLCTDTRQEFILLSDTLGVSMLVDALNHKLPPEATQTTVLGPFYVKSPPQFAMGADISPGQKGTPLFVSGTITDTQGNPLEGAVVDTWHSDEDGYYDVQGLDEGGDLSMRARFVTGADGRVCFRTVVPNFYPIPHDGTVGKMLQAQGRHPYRPAHIHFMVSASGYRRLVTHIFLDDDPYLDSDVVFGVKSSLIRKLGHHKAGTKAPDGTHWGSNFATLNCDLALAAAR